MEVRSIVGTTGGSGAAKGHTVGTDGTRTGTAYGAARLDVMPMYEGIVIAITNRISLYRLLNSRNGKH